MVALIWIFSSVLVIPFQFVNLQNDGTVTALSAFKVYWRENLSNLPIFMLSEKATMDFFFHS